MKINSQFTFQVDIRKPIDFYFQVYNAFHFVMLDQAESELGVTKWGN